jgi:hypothetical protein
MPCEKSPVNQYSLKFLLTAMTVCAVLLVAVRDLIPKSIGPPDTNSLLMISISLALFLLILMPAIYIPLALLSLQRFNRLLLVSPLLWAVLIWLTIEIVVATTNRFRMMPRDRGDVTEFVILAQAGAVTMGVISAFILRFAGCQLAAASPAGCKARIPEPA